MGGYDIEVDSDFCAYVTGYTDSTDFPTADNESANYGIGNRGAYIVKMSNLGSALIYTGFLGGDIIHDDGGIDLDGDGKAYITGTIDATDFPTVNPYQPSKSGARDAFVSRFVFTTPTPTVTPTATISPSPTCSPTPDSHTIR